MSLVFGDRNPDLSTGDMLRIDSVCDRFEERLQAGEGACLQELLGGFDEYLQPILLRQLLLLQWDYDRSRGEPINVVGHLAHFPEHAALIQAAAHEHLSDSDHEQASTSDEEFLQDAASVALKWEDSNYRIIRQLGSGGMGTVLLAKERVAGRLVAIKLLQQNPNRKSLVRFRAEIRALQRLRHPNIVRVFEINTFHDEPYYTMEYCPGGSLADELRRRRTTVRESALIVETLARAVHAAHQSGIIHRDLKPGNVLLQRISANKDKPQDAVEHSSSLLLDGRAVTDRFTLKLADFGLAKDLYSRSLTRSDELLGSLPYMAPEQLSETGSTRPAVDIHALGVILYECLTGQQPFADTTPAITIQRIIAQDAISPRVRDHSIPPDLAAICDRCLEKDPRHRFTSALDLADDLRRWRNGEPTQARSSGMRRLWRWGQRHPQQVTIMVAVCGLLMMIAAGLAWHSAQLRELNTRLVGSNRALVDMTKRAEASQRRSRQLHYESEVRLAGKFYREGDLKTARDILVRQEPAPDDHVLRGMEWSFLSQAVRPPGQTLADVGSPLYCVRLSSDRQLVAVAGQDGTIRILDRLTGNTIRTIESGQIEVNGVAFSADGDLLASAGDDGTVRVWQLTDGKQVDCIRAHQGIAFNVEFIPNTDGLISCGADGRVCLWNHGDGQEAISYEDHIGRVEAIAISPDGKWFVSAGKDRRFVVRDIHSGELKLSADDPLKLHRLSCVAFSPDSRQIALGEGGGESKAVMVIDLATGEPVWSHSQPDGLSSVAFSPDGSRLLSTDIKGIARLWAVTAEEQGSEENNKQDPLIICQVDNTRSYAAAFEDEAGSFLTVGHEGKLNRFEKQQSIRRLLFERPLELSGPPGNPTPGRLISAEFLSQGTELAATMGTKGIAICDFGSNASHRYHRRGQLGWEWVAAPQRENWFAVSGWYPPWTSREKPLPATVERWETTSGPTSKLYEASPNCSIHYLCCSPEGDFIAIVVVQHGGEELKQLLLLDANSGEVVNTFPAANGTKPRFTHDGRHLIYGVQRDIRLVELESGQQRLIKDAHQDSICELSISHDDNWLATSDDRSICIWDVETLQRHTTLQGHQSLISSLRFSSDGVTLLSSSFDGTVKAWSVSTGQFLLDLHLGSQPVNHIALSFDSNRLAVIENYERVWIYELADEEPRIGDDSEKALH